MTDRPATAAGRELLATLDPYNREDEWTHRRVSDILAIEEQAKEVPSVERIAEALNACGLIRRYQEYAAATVTMEPITGPYLAHEWASALRIALLVKTGEPK